MMRVWIAVIFLIGMGGCASLSGVSRRGEAKNVILFIGDGMGVSTVTAARIFAGQQEDGSGEEYVLPFERFEHLALVKTYNSNQQVPDSAGTASAIHSGRKTRAGVIGVSPDTVRGTCAGADAGHMRNLGEMAIAHGKAVGIVTTARLTHATPAAVYAHSPERNWEDDADMPQDDRDAGCIDIAAQLVRFPFDTALGGGGSKFRSKESGGTRLGRGVDLAEDWRIRTGGTVVHDLQDLADADDGAPVLGLFADSHMTYVRERTDSDEPTLSQMTDRAIKRLSRHKGGYYLMVEGGRIDHGHHAGKAGYALTEAVAFAQAVAVAVAATKPEETLILVTADHSHVFTIAGYPTRGNDILGHVRGNDSRGEAKEEAERAADGEVYTTLGYANGPGAVSGESGKRARPETGISARQQAAIAMQSETHGGEDVALYAMGAGAYRVGGVIEQNVIFDIMTDVFGWTAHTPSERTAARRARVCWPSSHSLYGPYYRVYRPNYDPWLAYSWHDHLRWRQWNRWGSWWRGRWGGRGGYLICR